MDNVKKKVYLDIFAAPGTLLPVAGGLTAWIASWAMGGNAAMNFAGLAGVMTGIGVLATRLILQLDKITNAAYEHTVEKQRRKQAEALEHLRERLVRDRDPRTQNCLEELRHLYARLKEKVDEGHVNSAAFGVIEGVDRIFRTCIEQLEHSVDLWETARRMRGSARDQILAQRESLVVEICETVDHLGKSVEKFHAVTTNKNRSELARLRGELDQSMEVARQVARRTEELTQTYLDRTDEFE
jgi:hypothetical protein